MSHDVTISSYEGRAKAVEGEGSGTRCHPHSISVSTSACFAGHGVVDPSEQQLSLAGPSAAGWALRYHRDQRLRPSLKTDTLTSLNTSYQWSYHWSFHILPSYLPPTSLLPSQEANLKTSEFKIVALQVTYESVAVLLHSMSFASLSVLEMGENVSCLESLSLF